MKLKINLPRGQKDVIIHALNHYQSALEQMVDSNTIDADDDYLRYQHFDCRQLIGIMADEEIDVMVELEEDVKETFVHRGHGVDFPEYS
jgi:hypothetical protein